MSAEKITPAPNEENKLDQWPKNADGSNWDGAGLLPLLAQEKSPFGDALDVRSLIDDLESSLGAIIDDVPIVTFGANHFGFSLILKDGRNIIARVSRGDMNKPGFDSDAMAKQIKQDHFELAVYDALAPLNKPFNCRPLYHRDPKKSDDAVLAPNQGRRMFLFEKADGDTYDYPRWRALSAQQKVWERSIGGSPGLCPVPVKPTREFCISLMLAKIDSTIGQRAREVDPLAGYHLISPSLETVRNALLRLVPLILPMSTFWLKESTLYRFVLDHGDFGVHNMTVALDERRQPKITSVYDWEGGSIVPAILCEPKMVTTVDLVIDQTGKPSISRWGDGDTPEKMEQYRKWTVQYYKVLFSAAPELKRIIKAGREARYLWFALRDQRGKDPDEHFRQLGEWAEKKLAQLERREENKRTLTDFFCTPSKTSYDYAAN